MKCRDCRFFHDTTVLGSSIRKGECRRRAPVLVGLDGRPPQPWGAFPETYPTDFCGEFEARDEERAAS